MTGGGGSAGAGAGAGGGSGGGGAVPRAARGGRGPAGGNVVPSGVALLVRTAVSTSGVDGVGASAGVAGGVVDSAGAGAGMASAVAAGGAAAGEDTAVSADAEVVGAGACDRLHATIPITRLATAINAMTARVPARLDPLFRATGTGFGAGADRATGAGAAACRVGSVAIGGGTAATGGMMSAGIAVGVAAALAAIGVADGVGLGVGLGVAAGAMRRGGATTNTVGAGGGGDAAIEVSALGSEPRAAADRARPPARDGSTSVFASTAASWIASSNALRSSSAV